MSALVKILLGLALETVFWSSISLTLLIRLGVKPGTHIAYVISALGFLWGYTLSRFLQNGPSARRKKLLLPGWLLPICLFGMLLVSTCTNPRVLPWGIMVSSEAGVYLVLWAICSVQGINRAQATTLHTLQKHSLLGTLVLTGLACFQPANRLDLATSALYFALICSVYIAFLRQDEIFKNTGSKDRNYWIAGGVLFLLAILALSAFASMGGPGAALWALKLIRKTWALFGKLIIYAFAPLGKAAEWLVVSIRKLIKQRPQNGHQAEPSFSDMLEAFNETNQPLEMPSWIQWAFSIAALSLVLWLIWRFLLKRETRHKQDLSYTEARINLLEKGAFTEWAESSLNQIASRVNTTVSRFLHSIKRNKPETVGELYICSLNLLSAQVIPFKQSKTPFEYLNEVKEHIPGEEGHLAFDYITTLFCGCHYSNRQPNTLEWEKALHAYWILTQPETLHLEAPGNDRPVNK